MGDESAWADELLGHLRHLRSEFPEEAERLLQSFVAQARLALEQVGLDRGVAGAPKRHW